METHSHEPSTCPRCKGPLIVDGVPSARSRVDGGTRICSPCGMWEAMQAHDNDQIPPIEAGRF